MAMPKLINELPAASLGAGDLLAAKVAGVTSQVTITQLITEAATFTQSGTGAVARTVQSKLRESVSVVDFGAVGDGVTDDTAAITAALAASSRVYFPSGTYLVSSAFTLTDDHHLYGDGLNLSIIRQDGTVSNGTGTLYANSGSSAAYIDRLYIHDLCIDGQVASKSFSEHQHLCSIAGVKDCVLERVRFLGFRGDGLYIGSGTSASDERHNVNVTVRDCVFDGVNKDNRNGISVIDADGLLIETNVFRNCTKSTMPGPIDVEPEANAFHIVRNITIRKNTFDTTDGAYLISIATVASALTAPLRGITIEDNEFLSSNTHSAADIYIATAETVSTVASMGINVSKNRHRTAAAPFVMHFVKGVRYENNDASGGTVSEIGKATDATLSVQDFKLSNNVFHQCSNVVGVVQVASAIYLDMEGNTIQPKDTAGHTNGITFFGSGVTTESSYVRVLNNNFVNGASQTHSIAVSGHTLTTASNTWHGNREGAALTNSFTYQYAAGGDRYEESTWTPVLAGTGTAGTQTYSIQVGSYTRIGRLVIAQFAIVTTAVDGAMTGNAQITGLPYTASNVANRTYAHGINHGGLTLTANYHQVTGLISPNTTAILIRQSGSAQTEAALSSAGLGAATRLIGVVSYFV